MIVTSVNNDNYRFGNVIIYFTNEYDRCEQAIKIKMALNEITEKPITLILKKNFLGKV